MMGSIDWYNEAIDVNGYSAEHHPEFLYISFPRRVSKREGEVIELYNRALGYTTTQFYRKRTIMITF